MVSCIVPLTFTTPDTTSPVQLLKKLKGKESENLKVVFAACACTDVADAALARIRDINIKRSIGNLTVLLLKKRRVRALFLSADVAAVFDMTESPFNRFVGSCFDLRIEWL